MLVAYLYWHYVSATSWLMQLTWNLELALLHFFSVGVMLRTLFAHWRRDVIAYHGSLQAMLIIFAWNQISRAVGFCVRITLLSLWAIVQTIFIIVLALVWLFFLSWPLLTLGALVVGSLLLV